MTSSTTVDRNAPDAALGGLNKPDRAASQAGSRVTEEPAVNKTVGRGFVTNMWYFAVASDSLKRGSKIAKTMLGKMVLIGRKDNGEVFCIEDICPHQAVPLSCGSFDGKEVECPFHGWRFDSSGVCTSIPSMCDGQSINLKSIKTKSFPVRENMGGVWVYFGDQPENPPELPQPFGIENVDAFDRTTTTLLLPNHIDYNAVALIDTAHVPYVHNSWWWRSSKNLKNKEKHYVPAETGWNIVRHKPSKHSMVYKLIGGMIEDEIGFRLPACRIERIIYNEETFISGITALTPIDDETTELNHTTYWKRIVPGTAPLLVPIIQYFVRTFLGQDKRIAELQQKCLAHDPKLIMTIKDAGTAGRWYFDLKNAWNQASVNKEPFDNPVEDSFLRWRS